jgi:hypothetical protein
MDIKSSPVLSFFIPFKGGLKEHLGGEFGLECE